MPWWRRRETEGTRAAPQSDEHVLPPSGRFAQFPIDGLGPTG